MQNKFKKTKILVSSIFFPISCFAIDSYDPKFIIIKDRNILNNSSLTIIADIGGTNSRFSIFHSDKKPRDINPWVTPTQSYTTLEELISSYLLRIPTTLNQNTSAGDTNRNLTKEENFSLTNKLDFVNSRIFLSLAAFVSNEIICSNDIAYLNGKTQEIKKSISKIGFSLDNIVLINDVMAVAVGIGLAQKSSRLLSINTQNAKCMIVIGCGTGLGYAEIRTNLTYCVISHSESGFESFVPANTEHSALLNLIKLKLKKNVILKRDILSGPGLVRLYNAATEALDIHSPIQKAEEVLNYALNDSADQHALAIKTVRIFCELIGYSFANTIVSSLANEIYLFGGLIKSLFESKLVTVEDILVIIRNENKESLSETTSAVRIHVISDDFPAFSGLKELAHNL
jgi:glucokinase